MLSKDTGFDPLIRHLLEQGHRCRRVNSVKSAFPRAANPLEPKQDHFGRLISLLIKEKARPTKRKGLANKVKSWFPKLSDEQRIALVQRLFEEAHIRELDRTLTYAL